MPQRGQPIHFKFSQKALAYDYLYLQKPHYIQHTSLIATLVPQSHLVYPLCLYYLHPYLFPVDPMITLNIDVGYFGLYAIPRCFPDFQCDNSRQEGDFYVFFHVGREIQTDQSDCIFTMVSLGNSIAVSWETKQCSPSFLCCCVVAVCSRNVFNKK